jgi:hypothetical protein
LEPTKNPDPPEPLLANEADPPIDDSRIERAFQDAFATLDLRIGLFPSLPPVSLDQLAIRKKVEEIGRA